MDTIIHRSGGLIAAFFVSCAFCSNAALYQNIYNSGFANSGNIPDGNPNGWTDTRTLSGISDFAITDVSLKLNVSGGYNGDLYAYLSHNGVLIPLLNRVGVGSSPSTTSAFGYGDSGFNVTLSDSGANGDIHLYQQASGYATRISNGSGWQADGRAIDPNSAPSSFDSASRAGFSSYLNANPNGDWTIFFADMSAGGGQSQLLTWELDVTAVPEPVNVALGFVASLFLLGGVVGRVRRDQEIAYINQA